VALGTVFPATAPPEALPSFARRIEQLGYDELWVIEDCFLSGGLALASTALAATQGLRVGVGLLPAAVRNPAIAAMEIATLGRLHPARLTVAFGHGVEAWMRQIGARAPKRVAALSEVVTAVRMLLAGEVVTMDGEWVRLDAVSLDNPPEIPPPILVGTTGPQGIAVAGRRADGLLLPEGCCLTFITQAKEQAAQPTRLPANPLEMHVYAWLRIGDDEASRAALTTAVTHWWDSGLYAGPARAAGIDAAPGDEPLDRRLADELAVVGTPEQCAAAVGRFRDAGAQRLILAAVGDGYEEQYESFADQVMPALTRADRLAS
jgi:5,10-methylenetetrahydromethanopterin reductase